MFSMTGFARAETKTSEHHLIWEVRTVNHRYLETTFKLPETLRSIEQALREQAKGLLARGKLDGSLKILGDPTSGQMTLNQPLLNSLINHANDLAQLAPTASPLTQSQLLSWPGMLIPADSQVDQISQAALTLFAEALQKLADNRAEEGAKLKQVLLTHLDAISQQVSDLAPMAADLPQLQQQRLQERVDGLKTEVDADRLAQEVALLAQKADVQEELDRLQIHVAQARTFIQSDGPHGRRLDFLTQELNREANTLGAKAINNELSTASIELKVIIEQIREQVQNIQ